MEATPEGDITSTHPTWVKSRIPDTQIEKSIPSRSPDEWRRLSTAIRQALDEIQAIERQVAQEAESRPHTITLSCDDY